jgi:aminoglycoside phosphotransferase (APT) family kinase protein
MRDALTTWIRSRLPDADDVWIEGLDRVEFGHSAEMMVFTVVEVIGGKQHRQGVVVRMRPRPPALLEPYDLKRQFDVLRSLEPTRVRAPRVLWLEESGDVLSRPFFVMERVAGTVYEMEVPEVTPEGIKRMCESMAEQLAAIHTLNIQAAGLDSLDDGCHHLDRELHHWASEMRRVQLGPLPALERLLQRLEETKPDASPQISLVHGDAKPGNFAFVGNEVSAVFDWELTTVGDPLTDIGYLEILWKMPVGIPSHSSALTIDDLLGHYEAASGIAPRHREWYRALNAFKLGVINLIGSRLFDDGATDDPRFVMNAYGIPLFTQLGLADLGINESLEDGPILPREERIQEVQSKASAVIEGA